MELQDTDGMSLNPLNLVPGKRAVAPYHPPCELIRERPAARESTDTDRQPTHLVVLLDRRGRQPLKRLAILRSNPAILFRQRLENHSAKLFI